MDELDLVAVGDILLAAELPGAADREAYLPLRDAGLTVANLECSITESATPIDKLINIPAPPVAIDSLQQLGMDVVFRANNHNMDFGVPGLEETTQHLDKGAIAHCGAGMNLDEAMSVATFTSPGGTRFGFVSVASTLPAGTAAGPNRPGVAPLRVNTSYSWDAGQVAEEPGHNPRVHTTVDATDEARLLDAVRVAKESHDVVGVSLHWGVSSGDKLSTFQRPLAHAMVDAGADVIIGHHPHRLHGIEAYKGRPIFYSLGHFVNQLELVFHIAAIDPAWMLTCAVQVKFVDGEVRGVQFFPYVLDDDGNPSPAGGVDRDFIVAHVTRMSALLGTAVVVDDDDRVSVDLTC